MDTVIKLPEKIFSRLEKHAVGFDTPANVIENLLNYFEGAKNVQPRKESKKDYTKYKFNDRTYGKGKLVLGVVGEYIKNHPNTTFNELGKIFPKTLQGSIGVFNMLEDVQVKYKSKKSDRHYTSKQHHIKLIDSTIVICTEWGATLNFEAFLEHAQGLGFDISADHRS